MHSRTMQVGKCKIMKMTLQQLFLKEAHFLHNKTGLQIVSKSLGPCTALHDPMAWGIPKLKPGL